MTLILLIFSDYVLEKQRQIPPAPKWQSNRGWWLGSRIGRPPWSGDL